jgi:uncharacterized protein YbbC (DUF1343 family)
MHLIRMVFLLLATALGLIATPARAQVQLGNEVLAAGGFAEVRGKRLGLITNPSGVNSRLEHTTDVLRRAAGVKLVALFAPEHGLRGDIPAGREFPNATDARTGLPVWSLYGPGPTRQPTPAMLKDLDALVYDIQDIGCRSYTFISTMGLAMEACAAAGVEFIVLDRPNPTGGERVEGPLLQPDFKSFVGQWPIPYLYGMTAGELARMINGEGWISRRCPLTVVPLKNWRRWMVWRDTGLPWVPTSPYMPFADSPLHYPSTGILGQIGGVSIGIGYTLPFQTIAAPWIGSGEQFAAAMRGAGLSGVRFLPVTYTPFYGAYRERQIQGVQVFFSEPARAPLLAVNFVALDAAKRSGQNLFAEAAKDRSRMAMFDKLMGTDQTRKLLLGGANAAAVIRSWRADEEAFRQRRQKYLLY